MYTLIRYINCIYTFASMEVITLEYMKDISLIYVNKKDIPRINQKRNV